MKKVFKKGISLFLALLMLTSGISVFASDTAAANSSPRIFIIGDSTACSYASDSDRTGWGEALQKFLTDPKMIVNAASSGDSSHSFYDEEWNWNTVKARLKKGDYLLIQFGHNDSAQSGEDDEGNTITDLSRYSNPELSSSLAPPTELSTSTDDYSYKWYLKQYIEYANSVGAYPILVTSVERRGHNTYSEENSSLYKYVTAMEELSQQEYPTVPVIDVWRGVRAGYAEDWYVSDGTHLAEKGAMEVARIFANGIKASSVASAQSLANYLVSDIDAVTTHTDIIDINEDFEDYTVQSEGNLFPGKPLNSTVTAVTNGKYAYIVAENETNNVVKLANGTTGGVYTISWKFPYVLSSGYYKLKYRFKSNGITENMVFATTIGTYAANTRYAKNSINKSGGDNLSTYGISLKDGEWVEVEYYIDPAKGNLDIFCEGNDLGAGADGKSTLKNLAIVSIGFPSSGAGTNAELYLDDIEFGEISEQEYNLTMGNIPVIDPPEGITAIEDFEYAKAGTAIGTTHYGWKRESSASTVPMTYVTDPENENNLVANIKSTVSKINANRTLAYTLTNALSDYAYSVKFRLYADDADSNEFWISVMDTDSDGSENADKSSRHYIGFRMNTDYVTMYSTNDGITNSEAAANYDFNLNTWYDIEVVYDLTPELTINASVYINGERLINRARVGGGANYTNDGTITSFQFQIPSDTRAHVLGDAVASDGIYASFLLDDIVIKQTSIVTGVTAAEGKLSTISAYFDKAPSTAPKFVAAVYDGRALKDVAFANATAMVGTQSATLSKQLSVESGNTVKVYYWDMTNLIPCIKMFETDIQ